MHIRKIRNKLIMAAASLAAVTMSGCSMVTDDMQPCPAQLRLRFVYDYNIKFADAFANEVTSVNVWAFDDKGNFVWSGSAAGETLSDGNFYLDVPLPEGRYDFVSWCGLLDNTTFRLATYEPTSKEELKMTLETLENAGGQLSENRLSPVFHGYVSDALYEIDPLRPVDKVVTLSLMKDTKDIRIMLQHLDGSAIENRDFTVRITDANKNLDWNNDLLPSPTVYYKPWAVKYGETSAPDGAGDGGTRSGFTCGSRTVTTVASLLFELSTSRLMVNSNAVLTVHRNSDDTDIIRIPLIDYLLLVRGHYFNKQGQEIGEQEYLDRQDDYSMVFFIDKNSNWYMAAGIYINNWAVVPPQTMPL